MPKELLLGKLQAKFKNTSIEQNRKYLYSVLLKLVEIRAEKSLMILKATSEYRVVFLYLFWITTIFRTSILSKTNKCHHGTLGEESPGQFPRYPLHWSGPDHRTLKWAFEESVPSYCYAIKTNGRTISKVSQPASAGKWADISELQVHHYTKPEQCTWLVCSVIVISANKLSVQELNQLIGINADDRFSGNFGSSSQFSGK